MPENPSTSVAIASAIELAFLLVGGVLIWRLVLSRGARADRTPSPLAAWEARPEEFAVFLGSVLVGYFFVGLTAASLARAFGLVGDTVTVVTGAGAQLGMLAGLLISRAIARSVPALSPPSLAAPPVPPARPNVFVSGAAVFLMALPPIILTSKLCELALKQMGLPVEKQDLIGIIMRAESPWLIVTMILLATVIAPVAEELFFRAGIFRYLRTRVSRNFAYTLSALIFAVPHVNWTSLAGLVSAVPLLVLAVIFSAAYERTGRIGTVMVAHALFNFNVFLVVLAGGQDL